MMGDSVLSSIDDSTNDWASEPDSAVDTPMQFVPPVVHITIHQAELIPPAGVLLIIQPEHLVPPIKMEVDNQDGVGGVRRGSFDESIVKGICRRAHQDSDTLEAVEDV